MSICEQTSDQPVFDFPESIKLARTVLIKPNVGYPAQPPVIVRMTVLRSLVEQVLALRTDSQVLIVEGVCSKVSTGQVFNGVGLSKFATDRVRVIDAETLPQAVYVNTAAQPNRFAQFVAPAALRDVDARISIAPFKRTMLHGKPLISASIKNLYGLLPRSEYCGRSPHARGQLHRPNVHAVIADVYHTLGVLFDFGIIDLHEKYVSDDEKPDRGRAVPVGRVLSGSDLVALDLQACTVAAEPVCDYLRALNLERRL